MITSSKCSDPSSFAERKKGPRHQKLDVRFHQVERDILHLTRRVWDDAMRTALLPPELDPQRFLSQKKTLCPQYMRTSGELLPRMKTGIEKAPIGPAKEMLADITRAKDAYLRTVHTRPEEPPGLSFHRQKNSVRRHATCSTVGSPANRT